MQLLTLHRGGLVLMSDRAEPGPCRNCRDVQECAERKKCCWPKSLPLGCDYQGRHPEAAHAASEIEDADKGPMEGAWLVTAPALGLAVWIVAALVMLAVFWPG